jgi:uncharacterized membrane protein YqjE
LEFDSDTPREGTIEGEPGPIASLFRSIARLASTFVAIAHTRLELLTTEVQQELYRVAAIMVWTLVALAAAAIGLFMAALAIVLVFWDTHRVVAAVLVTTFFFLIALVALLVLRAKVKSKPPLLEATLAELATDATNLNAAAARRYE